MLRNVQRGQLHRWVFDKNAYEVMNYAISDSELRV